MSYLCRPELKNRCMKSRYLALVMVFLVNTISAQVSSLERRKMPSPLISAKKAGIPTPKNTSKAIIWQSDFSMVSDWTIGNSSGNNANWIISNSPSFWWSGNATLASNSGGNAASFNSDGYATAANQIENNAWIQSDTINCSNFPTVAVSFEQFFNKWTGRTFIEVSNDLGQTWVDYEVNESMDNNDETLNPSAQTVNITATAGLEPQVLIRFLYLSNAISDGGTNHTAGEAWDYGWIIDYVIVEELPDNDIALVKGWHADIVNDYEYSMVPLTQVREMIPGVILANQGALGQTLDVTATISDAGGVVNTTTQSITIPSGISDTVWFQTGYTPSSLGDYDVTFSIPADQDLSDNNANAATLSVTMDKMAHDYGASLTFGWNPASTNPDIVENANAVHSWGNIYYPQVDQDIYGVDINFASGTSPGLVFGVRVQQIDPVGGIQGNLTFNNEQYYTVQASDIGMGITTVVFPQPSTLVAGEGYIIDVLKVDGTSGQGFYIGGSDDFTEDDDFSTVAFGPYGANNAINYYVSWDFTPYIRANFDATLNVENLSLEGISIYPNPSEGIITIENETDEISVVTVMNLEGKVLRKHEINTTGTIDLSATGTGVYLVKVSNERGSFVERVLIE